MVISLGHLRVIVGLPDHKFNFKVWGINRDMPKLVWPVTVIK